MCTDICYTILKIKMVTAWGCYLHITCHFKKMCYVKHYITY